MDVALLTWAFPPEKSGLSRAAAEIADALAAAGARVRVFTLDREGRREQAGIEVIGCADLGARNARLRRVPAIGHLVAPLAFRRAVLAEHRRRPFDVIEATNWYAPAAALTFGTIPVVTRNSTPNATSIKPGGSPRDRVDRWMATMIERVAARRSAGLISNTRAHGAKMAALYGVALPGEGHAAIGLSLPNAIVAQGRAAPYPPEPARRRVEMLFVGRDEPRKGFDAIAAALPMLVDDEDYHLTIVGIAPDRLPTWPDAVRQRVDASHRVSDERLHDLLADADVVLAPSRYESFGLVYQEAMAFGRPIVACAEDPSARQFVGDSGAGVLATACTCEALVAVLRSVLTSPALRQTLSDRARAAAGQFTRETLGRETLAAYRSAIASYGRNRRASSWGRAAPSAIAP